MSDRDYRKTYWDEFEMEEWDYDDEMGRYEEDRCLPLVAVVVAAAGVACYPRRYCYPRGCYPIRYCYPRSYCYPYRFCYPSPCVPI